MGEKMIAELIDKSRSTSKMASPDDDSIGGLFQLHAPMAVRTAFRILRERSLAEDVLQETFLRIHCMKGRIDSSQNIAGLIRKIAVNLSIDILRKRSREAPLEFDNDENTDSAPEIAAPITPADVDNLLLARQLLGCLPPKDRMLLELRYGEQLSYEELARALDLSADAVAQRIRRAKAALRRAMETGKRRKP